MSRAHKPGAENYEVGYRRPPVATRFKPGQCGNPKNLGRRRKTVGDDIRAAMTTRVKVVENGRTRTLTAQQVILRNLVNEAARKNMKAITTLFALAHRYATSDEETINPADLHGEDREILQAFIDQLRLGNAPADDPQGTQTTDGGNANG